MILRHFFYICEINSEYKKYNHRPDKLIELSNLKTRQTYKTYKLIELTITKLSNLKTSLTY